MSLYIDITKVSFKGKNFDMGHFDMVRRYLSEAAIRRAEKMMGQVGHIVRMVCGMAHTTTLELRPGKCTSSMVHI
jgi:hypothetical protein